MTKVVGGYAAGIAAILFGLAVSVPPFHAEAQNLQRPIIEHAQEDLDTCALGEVTGLKADGDGFLAVRAGPGTQYRKLDQLYNGDAVLLFDRKGKWLGIVYGVAELSCSPIRESRPVPHRGRKGWVHENWIRVIAG
ncbi:MAG: SH3 domain-containing protein [Pseudomonadota bacterium]